MKITDFETFDCELGWRTVSFLKISTESGLSGWSEYVESFGNGGLTAVINRLRGNVVGKDAARNGLIVAELAVGIGPAPSGINRQAVGAIENALLDLKARSLGVPVADLIGGSLRSTIPVYWSHCGTYRQGAQAGFVGKNPVGSYSELRDFARDLRDSGFSYFKTNMIAFEDEGLRRRPQPWTRRPSAPGREWDRRSIVAIENTLSAFREGLGTDVNLILDINIGFTAEGVRRIAEAVEPYDLEWLELDGLSPRTMSDVRAFSSTPLASGESLFGRGEYQPYFDAHSVDLAIVDAVWNGVGEAAKIANAAQTVGLDIAPHNFYGHLSTMMSAQLCSAVPNVSILEVDIDGVSWRDDLLSQPPVYQDGYLMIPDGPGWGVEVNEEAVRAHAGY